MVHLALLSYCDRGRRCYFFPFFFLLLLLPLSDPRRSSIAPLEELVVDVVDFDDVGAAVVAGAVVVVAAEPVAGAVPLDAEVAAPGVVPAGALGSVGGAGASSASCTAYSAGIERSSSSGRPSLGYFTSICRLMSAASFLVIFAGAPCLTLVETTSWNVFK